MCDISDPFSSMYGITKTEKNVSDTCSAGLKKDQQEDKNDYRVFFDKENFEKHIEMYPKTEVRKRVLGRVRIPD